MWYYKTMKIRLANKKDNFETIAKLIYETDRYIYPYWFQGDKTEGIKVISNLMKDSRTSFYYEKCIVAEIQGKIVGMLLFFDETSGLDYQYSEIINHNFNYLHTIKNYIIPLEKSIGKNESYVAGIRVDDGFMRRGIAEKMMNFYFEKLKKGHKVFIDVLLENVPATCLYKKVGFKILQEYKGYNGYRKKKPICYSMIKTI